MIWCSLLSLPAPWYWPWLAFSSHLHFVSAHLHVINRCTFLFNFTTRVFKNKLSLRCSILIRTVNQPHSNLLFIIFFGHFPAHFLECLRIIQWCTFTGTLNLLFHGFNHQSFFSPNSFHFLVFIFKSFFYKGISFCLSISYHFVILVNTSHPHLPWSKKLKLMQKL